MNLKTHKIHVVGNRESNDQVTTVDGTSTSEESTHTAELQEKDPRQIECTPGVETPQEEQVLFVHLVRITPMQDMSDDKPEMERVKG